MEEFAADPDAWFFIVTDHKTEEQFEQLGRFMPPELKALLPKIVKFGDKERNLFLPPARKTTARFSITKASKDAAAVYLPPDVLHPDTTLLRKAIETDIAVDKIKAAEMDDHLSPECQKADKVSARMARCAAHSLKTSGKNYILESGDPMWYALN